MFVTYYKRYTVGDAVDQQGKDKMNTTHTTKRQVLGPAAHLPTVRKLARAWDRAVRVEEGAETIELAYRLAAKSDRALVVLRAAQNAVALPVANTARNRGRAGLRALASLGRAIARAVTARASLAKAQAANAARKVARAARRSMRAAILVVSAIAMSAVATSVNTSKETVTMSTSKLTTLPFLPTHKLSASLKGGAHMTAEVMAVATDDGVTRLYTSEEVATASKAPEWRATGLVSTSTYKLQRNRKDATSASLEHVTGRAVYFVVRGGELVSWSPAEAAAAQVLADGEAIAAVEPTVELDQEAADERVVAAIDEYDAAADVNAALREHAAKTEVAKAKKPKRAAATRQAIPTITDVEIAADAPKTPAPKTEKTHRPGSVMAMSLDELKAEFTAKTKLPAPDFSIHYMRKQVLLARNGKKDFAFRESKSPTTVTLDRTEARILAEVFVGKRQLLDETCAPIVAKLLALGDLTVA